MACTDISLDLPALPEPRRIDPLVSLALRLAAGGRVPAAAFRPPLPARAAKTGRLRLEIVTHCWLYAHFLDYQLSSLVLFPPGDLDLTVSVYHSLEDADTRAVLRHFAALSPANVDWEWRALPREQLFRRAIGRNHAALNSRADWLWFTDCDLLFRQNCLDSLAAALQGRRDSLLFPREERITELLDSDDLLLRPAEPAVRDVPAERFRVKPRNRATGPLQICHGDVARAIGYCADLRLYQTPAPRWCKAHEDRAFRWLLGTQGEPVDIPGVYRIRHLGKGRYHGRLEGGLRGRLRRLAAPWEEKRR